MAGLATCSIWTKRLMRLWQNEVLLTPIYETLKANKPIQFRAKMTKECGEYIDVKKNSVIILSVALVIVTIGVGLSLYFSDQSEKNTTSNNSGVVAQKDTRELIWEKLPSAQKERVNGTWQDSILSKVTLDKNAVAWIDDKSYEGKEVYLVDFPTKNMGVPNNMLIYADVDTYKYIGNAPVD